jgi:hypothetical protein
VKSLVPSSERRKKIWELMMMEYLKKQLDAGHVMATIMSVGGNMQVALKVKVEAADAVGLVARVKGLMGGLSEPRLIPWACISYLSWD